MRRTIFVCLLAPLLATSVSAQDESGTRGPLDLGAEERATVRLVLVDTVVIDSRGRTVPDLTLEDFEVFALGHPVEIDTLDVDCRVGAVDDPEPMRRTADRPSLPATESPRRIVMAFDYLHLTPLQREEAIDQAMRLLKNGGTSGDEVMVAALNGGLRVEQTFTADTDAVYRSLRRMGYDVTLWNGYFEHVNEYGFVDGLTGLFDVLGSVPGPKAVVLYSAMEDAPLENQFEKLAAIATVSRCSIYPVDVRGLYDEGRPIEIQPGTG